MALLLKTEKDALVESTKISWK